MINEILNNNKQFLQQTNVPQVGHAPCKRTAIVTCMDCRLVGMFESALGLERGDVLELRTAGATISQPDRVNANNDLIRSLAGGIYLLGVREIIVVGHTECGLTKINPTALSASMQAMGVDPKTLIEQEHLGNMDGLVNWMGAFQDVHINVQQVVDVIKKSPFLPDIPVHGLVIDINTGELTTADTIQ
ncbi:MAG TPA: carbonic anhydrase [Dictyobacter sp.]|jgi:carbonic anhydrase|nr:carbonic anhydrase [Dictyobacter sp.]